MRDTVFSTLSALAACHSPSGVEDEIDALLVERLGTLGQPTVDGGGNIVLRVPGREPGPLRAVLAHKDEIGALVKRVGDDGRLYCQTLGDAHPWIWGEGPVDVLGRHAPVLGVLSFGARHVSEESPQRKQLDDTPLRWRDVWVETKLAPEALAEAGVVPGSRVVPTRARKPPVRLGAEGEYVAAYALDDRAAVAALLLLAERLSPLHDVELVFTAREEIGCQGAQWYARRTDAEALLALEVVPVAVEYGLEPGPSPVIIRGDSNGPLDDGLSAELEDAAAAVGRPVRQVVVSRYGSDASKVLGTGRVGRTACLGVATENTHGFEIAHLDAIAGCVDVLDRWLG
ncbi:MAG: M20/M25/M40 family metallo-hydrolase [Gaiellales bacterium]